jgi:hypothetical protein
MANESAWRKGQQDAFQRRPAPNLARVPTPVRDAYLRGQQAGLKQIQGSKKSGK